MVRVPHLLYPGIPAERLGTQRVPAVVLPASAALLPTCLPPSQLLSHLQLLVP